MFANTLMLLYNRQAGLDRRLVHPSRATPVPAESYGSIVAVIGSVKRNFPVEHGRE